MTDFSFYWGLKYCDTNVNDKMNNLKIEINEMMTVRPS